MKNKRYLFKKGSIFTSWLVSYFVIIAFCIAVSSVIYLQAYHIVQQEMNMANNKLIGQIRQSIDARLLDIKTLGFQISTDGNLKSLYYLNEPLSNYDRYTEKEVYNDFELLKGSNSFIEFFYVWFSGFDSIPATDGVYGGEVLFNQYYQNSGMTYEQWVALQQKTHSGEFLPLYGKQNKGNSTIAFMKSLLINEDNYKATVTILFDRNKLLGSIQNMNLVSESSVCILDSQNNIISSSGQIDLTGVRYSSLYNDNGMIYQIIGKKKMAVTYKKSEVNDWKYITVIPVSIYGQKVNQMRRLTYFSIFICLALGGVIAYIFAKKNYHPVQNILNYVNDVQKKMKNPASDTSNEFNIIEEFIKSNQLDKEKYYKGWEQHSAEVRANFLNRLLKGELDGTLSIIDMLSTYHIHFDSNSFAVLLFSIEDYNKFLGEEGFKALEVVKFAISNVAEEIFSRNGNAYIINCGDMVACLINFKAENEKENKDEILQNVKETKTCFEEKLGIFVTISVSQIHKDISSIPVAYHEAMEAMEYRIMLGSGSIIKYEEIKPTQSTYSYSFETERHLITSIKAGDYNSAILTLNGIFNGNFAEKYMSIEMTRCFMFGLINTMVQILDEINSICDNSFLESLKPINRLLKCKTLASMKKEMETILHNICEHIRESREKNRNDELRDKIIDYIDRNYKDSNLTITKIADEMAMSQISISRFFKEQEGISLFDFINKYRLKEAKELLRQGSTVNRVATEVGYYNANTFIRTFKKYEGVTPGKWSEG